MAVRTKRLASGRITTNVAATIYTCPAGETAIVKHIAFFNLSTTVQTQVSITADIAGFNLTTVHRFLLFAEDSAFLDVWIVVPAGLRLGIRTDPAASVNFLVSGTELEGVAD